MLRGNGHIAAIPAAPKRNVGEHPNGLTGLDGDSPEAPLTVSSRGRSWLNRSPDYERVVQLMDAMRTHFDKQDRRAEELAASVDRVAATLDRLAEAQKSQNEHMSSVAENVRHAREHAATLTHALREMPASIQSQAELARLLARQMEAAGETDGQLVRSLQHFSTAAESLRASGAAQFETLQRIHASDQEQKQTLIAFVRDQNRRFLVGALIVAGLGIGTLVTLVVTLVTLLGR
jgi:hypothetical protein